jgi:hypothetical protein
LNLAGSKTLVRQLIYDFKSWHTLEATGRSGSDDGFDVRGLESGADAAPVSGSDEEELTTEDPDATPQPDRLWLIQCKREKSIPPKKLAKYARDIKDSELYGVIFVAACDFSKKARDSFLSLMRARGLQEVHILGRSELEDMLFQPKNDHLLFAYFGVSLQIRRRSLRTQIRSKLSMKRKAISSLGELHRDAHKAVLLRDANGSSHPFKDAEFQKRANWYHAFFIGHYHDGIVIRFRKHFAYLYNDRKHWDYVPQFNDVEYASQPLWQENKERRERWEERRAIEFFWQTISEINRAWLEVYWNIPYQDIVAIDADGDAYVRGPHIYVPFDSEGRIIYARISVNNQVVADNPDIKNRKKFFPKKFPPLSSDDVAASAP